MSATSHSIHPSSARPSACREGRIERLAGAHGITPYALILSVLADSGGSVQLTAQRLCVSATALRRAMVAHSVRNANTVRITRLERLAWRARLQPIEFVRREVARHGSLRAFSAATGISSGVLHAVCGPELDALKHGRNPKIRIGQELYTAKEIYELWGPVDRSLGRYAIEAKAVYDRSTAAQVIVSRLHARGVHAVLVESKGAKPTGA